MADKQGTFDIGSFIADQGLTLIGVDGTGSPLVKDKDGNEGTFNVAAALKDFGFSPKDVELKFNDTASAVEGDIIGGVSLADRAKLALGNTKGQISFLKQKYEDAAVDEKNGLVVRHKGVWHKVDKSGMDPWELTKDIVEGAISFVPSAAASAVGAAKGAALGAAAGPAGAVAGGIAGAATGGGASEGVRTLLGRWAGTYDATPEEQLKDIGLEALLNAGGQGVAAGVKPAFSMLAKAGRAISDTAAPATKELFAAVVGTTTGAGQNAARILLQDPDGVALASSKALQDAGGDALVAVNNLKAEQVGLTKRLAEMARPKLRSLAEKLDNELMDAVPDNFKGDVTGEVNAMLKQMEAAGLGRFVDDGAEVGKILDSSGTAVRSVKEGTSRSRFKLGTWEDVEKGVEAGTLKVEGLTKDALSALGEFVDQASIYARAPATSGKAAAKEALSVRRSINKVVFTLKDKVDRQTFGTVAQFSAELDNKLVSMFTEAGEKVGKERGALIAERFNNMRDTYKRYADVVSEAERFASEKNGSEIFLNKIISVPGSQATAKGDLDLLVELTGNEGKRVATDIARKEGAKGFTRVWPNPSKLTAAVGAGAAAYGATSGDLGAGAAVGAAAIASPRAVLKQVVYGKKFLGFLQGLTPKARGEWLRNPQLVEATLREVTKAGLEEDEMSSQMLQSAEQGKLVQ